MRLDAGAEVTLDLPAGHNAMIAVLSGHVTIDGQSRRRGGDRAVLASKASSARVQADGTTMLLVLTGEPIDEPVVGYGPFVMTTDAEIRRAIVDFRGGRMGRIAN